MKRSQQLEKIKTTTRWDMVVIGGGATGLGTALDAASRGYKVLCIEKYDFSKGTSSRSTKLIHGGVRYLEQGNIAMVRDALFERWFFLKNAPQETRTISFILPVYSWWRWLYYGFGLKLYDTLSGKYSIGKTEFLSAAKVKEAIPEIKTEKLKGGIRYWDGQFDDSRICLSLARTAISKGATVINHMSAESFTYCDHKIDGLVMQDLLSGEHHKVKAGVVINATGVFADYIMHMDNKEHHNIVAPSQGIHIVVDKKFYNSDEAMLIPRTSDGRVLFAVPWNGRVIIGTTDEKADHTDEEPQAGSDEIKFVLDNFNKYTSRHLSPGDIKSVYAGLRPLVRSNKLLHTADLIRDHTVLVSKSGLVTVTGGKWTTYRKMARDTVSKATRVAGLPFRRCRTRNLQLQAGPVADPGLPADILHKDHPFTTADVIMAVREDMACTLEDVLARRIRLLFLDAEAAVQCAPGVCRIIQQELGHEDEWVATQLNAFYELAKKYLPLPMQNREIS